MKKAQVKTTTIVIVTILIVIAIAIIVIAINLSNKPTTTGNIVNQENTQSETTEQIQLSQNNFYSLGNEWQSVDSYGYKYNPDGWCYSMDYDRPPNDYAYIKLKLLNIPEKYQKKLKCKVYEDSKLLKDYESGANIVPHDSNDPSDIRQITVLLSLNKNHNLNICCYVFTIDNQNNEIKPISNEVCFNQQVNKINCKRNLETENYYHKTPTYFTE